MCRLMLCRILGLGSSWTVARVAIQESITFFRSLLISTIEFFDSFDFLVDDTRFQTVVLLLVL
jgi:hypothetical protein